MKIVKCFALGLFAALSLGVGACKSDESHDHNHNDSELITTIRLTYTSSGLGTDVVRATYKDPDGAGGAAPTVDVIRLKANTSYNVTVEVLNESKNPAENLTPEILAEGAEHQFFFVPSGSSLAFDGYGDKDNKGLPIGLVHKQKTGAAGTGKLRAVLKHITNNQKTANSTINTGETDADVNFDVVIN